MVTPVPLALLFDVPITIGTDPVQTADIFYTTFCALKTPEYHIIQGRQILTSLYALLDIQFGNLTITTPLGCTKIISTMPGHQMKATPVYMEAATRISHHTIIPPTPPLLAPSGTPMYYSCNYRILCEYPLILPSSEFIVPYHLPLGL